MTQAPTQTQLSLHEQQPAAYQLDDSAEFNQDAQPPEPQKLKDIENTPHSKPGMDYAAHIADATPAMKQYFKAKVEHPDSLLFYRMGDFYEMFFDDALEAAEILGIALTKRGKQGEQDIPMCGVPSHAYEAYAQKLIHAGKRVAVCEQMEKPEEAKKRGYKEVVRRDVVRILTPGTLTEDALLDASSANFLAAIGIHQHQYAIAWADCSTGEIYCSSTESDALLAQLARINPRELVLSDAMEAGAHGEALRKEYQDIMLSKPAHLFERDRAEHRLLDTYKLASLAPLGDLQSSEISALGALLEYLSITQKSSLPRLDQPKRIMSQHIMQLDAATQRNLELTRRQNGEKKLSLLHSIDRTKTAAGARLLTSWLVAPLTDIAAIHARHDSVDLFVSHAELKASCSTILSSALDSERALSRLAMDRASPRDMLAVKHSLMAACAINGCFEQHAATNMPVHVQRIWQACRGHDTLIETLQSALKPEAAGLLREGNFIQPGYHAALDEHRNLKEHGRQKIAAMQAAYREETGINSLKIKFNHVLGYFVEITPTHQQHITERFIHRQTLASCLRYTTTELSELEQNIAQASDRALKLELEIFEQLRQELLSHSDAIISAARALAELDVYVGFAELATSQHYTRPVVDNSMRFDIKNGRHPVVENSLKKQGEAFMANDCQMDDAQRLWLLTGPNMAGKSTFLRQNALIAILAQCGSFVPAESAHIGVIDKLFSRVGAADDLARGQSTFMVEMNETATILNQAGQRSFVILDEIGRGTATYDGLSIAWAVVEHMHNTLGCRTLFATHYHELTQLEQELDALRCYHMHVKQWQGQLVFMHQLAPGKAEGSYGVHVAKLAGLPEPVIQRADQLLAALDKTATTSMPKAEPTAQPSAASSPALEKLRNLCPDDLTPKQALDALFELKQLS